MILHFSRNRAATQNRHTITTPSDTTPIRLLMIGESRWCRSLLQQALDGIDLVIDAVSDISMGRAAAARVPYDMIVLFLPLGQTGGPAACHQLRLDNLTYPIVVIDLRHDTNAIINTLDAGADAYLSADIPVAELRARLCRLLQRHGHMQPAAAMHSSGSALYSPVVMRNRGAHEHAGLDPLTPQNSTRATFHRASQP